MLILITGMRFCFVIGAEFGEKQFHVGAIDIIKWTKCIEIDFIDE